MNRENPLTATGEELALVRQLVAGDRTAWHLFVQRYQALVYSRIAKTAQELQLRLVPSDHEDLSAEVFASLLANDFSSLRRFQGRSQISTWISVIARRICLKHLTRLRHTQSIENIHEPVEHHRSGSTNKGDTLDALIRKEETEELLTALDKLRDSDRAALRMFYFENLKYEEIGRRMQISTNAVGPKLHRAHRRLRRVLTAEENSQDKSQ